jgi:hypothetical protein
LLSLIEFQNASSNCSALFLGTTPASWMSPACARTGATAAVAGAVIIVIAIAIAIIAIIAARPNRIERLVRTRPPKVRNKPLRPPAAAIVPATPLCCHR